MLDPLGSGTISKHNGYSSPLMRELTKERNNDSKRGIYERRYQNSN